MSAEPVRRMIRNVFLVQGDAADVAAHLRSQGKHHRIYTRHARAENLTVTMWVVVADTAGWQGA